MATEPTYEEIKRAVLDAMAARNMRAGEIIRLTNIQLQLHPKFRAAEVQDALNKMITEGVVTYDGGSFVKLTDAGYIQM